VGSKISRLGVREGRTMKEKLKGWMDRLKGDRVFALCVGVICLDILLCFLIGSCVWELFHPLSKPPSLQTHVMTSLIVSFWLVLVVWLENFFLLEWRRILHQKRWGNCAHLLLLILFPLSALLMLVTIGLAWWHFPPPSFVPWISVAALPAFSFGWTQFLKWLQSKTFRADTADSLFPYRKRTVFPLDAIVSIIRNDGRFVNGFIIRYDGWIVTANHCVAGEGKVWVALANGDLMEGEVVHRKPEWDMALVKVTFPYHLPTVRLGNNKSLRLGSEVVIVGWSKERFQPINLPREQDFLRCFLKEPNVVPMRVHMILEPIEEKGFAVASATGSQYVGPGFSGSPTCHPRTGKVIGVCCWGRTKNGVADSLYFVPIELLWRFLKEKGIFPKRSFCWKMPIIGNKDFMERKRKFGFLLNCIYLDTLLMSSFIIPDQEKQKEMEQNIEEIVSVIPKFPLGWVVRGRWKFLQGDIEGAKEDARKSLSLAPNMSAYELLYEIAMKESNLTEAVEAARQLVPPFLFGKEVENLLDLIKVLKDKGELEEALNVCKEAEELERSGRTLLAKGEILEAMDRWEEAKKVLQDAIQIDPQNGLARFALMRVLVALGGEENLKEAIRQGIMAQGRMHSIPKGFFETMAKAYEGLGLTEKAKEALKMERMLSS
jgi:tetratricopeptide (TPR) repeat protein